MTRERTDGIDSPFSDWLRKEKSLDSVKQNLSITDADYWIHQYRETTDSCGTRGIESIMMIELKTNSASLPFAQRDTLKLINAGFHNAFYDQAGRVVTKKVQIDNKTRFVRFYGAFLLQIDTDRPDTSKTIKWHGKVISYQVLLNVLAFKRDPRTLNERDDKRHHAASNAQKHGDLFKIWAKSYI